MEKAYRVKMRNSLLPLDFKDFSQVSFVKFLYFYVLHLSLQSIFELSFVEDVKFRSRLMYFIIYFVCGFQLF